MNKPAYKLPSGKATTEKSCSTIKDKSSCCYIGICPLNPTCGSRSMSAMDLKKAEKLRKKEEARLAKELKKKKKKKEGGARRKIFEASAPHPAAGM